MRNRYFGRKHNFRPKHSENITFGETTVENNLFGEKQYGRMRVWAITNFWAYASDENPSNLEKPSDENPSRKVSIFEKTRLWA